MNRDLIDELFEPKFVEEIISNYPWKQVFYNEDPDGVMSIRKVLPNIVSVILHKEHTTNTRFISIIPKYGIQYMVALSRLKTERPIILDTVSRPGVDTSNLVNLSISEVYYFIEKFIKGVITNEEKKSI